MSINPLVEEAFIIYKSNGVICPRDILFASLPGRQPCHDCVLNLLTQQQAPCNAYDMGGPFPDDLFWSRWIIAYDFLNSRKEEDLLDLLI